MMPDPLPVFLGDEMTITIIGAGMAGLLAANMLQRHRPVVLEKAPSLPNNHTAVLRFRSSVVGDTVGIPFRKVSIIKDTLTWRNPVADALAYSYKNMGQMRSDRSVTAGLTVAERYIAPPDFIERMADGHDIAFGTEFKPDLAHGPYNGGQPVISTIPMPDLMALLNYDPPFEMQYSPAVNVRARVKDCDAYVSLLVTNPGSAISRISLTGDELVVELPRAEPAAVAYGGDFLHEAATLLGLSEDSLYDQTAHASRYAKILPVPDDARREFIYWASTEHNIYSLGRFACWKPGLLLDDLVQDVRKIEGWLGGQRRYDRAKDR